MPRPAGPRPYEPRLSDRRTTAPHAHEAPSGGDQASVSARPWIAPRVDDAAGQDLEATLSAAPTDRPFEPYADQRTGARRAGNAYRPPYDRGRPGLPYDRGRPGSAQNYAAASVPSRDLIDGDDEIVAGRRPVEEAFVARREVRRLLVVPQRRHALEKLVLHATSLRLPIVEVEGGTLTALAGFDGHQGIALVVEARRAADLDDILARAIQRGEPPFALVLDSLEDPQNFGTLLRSAEAAGIHGVVFPTKRQAPLSPAAVKASAGAVEHLHMAQVDDLAGALADLHARGLRIVGADADASLTVREADLRGPLAIVVGSEGQGLGPAVRRRCDLLVRIPMRGAVGSLNASVAGSILLYEAATQRAVAELATESPTVAADAPAPTRARARKRDRAAHVDPADDAATNAATEGPEPDGHPLPGVPPGVPDTNSRPT